MSFKFAQKQKETIMYKCWSCGTEHESPAPSGASNRELEADKQIIKMILAMDICEDYCCRNGCSVPTGKHCRGDACSCTAGFVRDLIVLKIGEMK